MVKWLERLHRSRKIRVQSPRRVITKTSKLVQKIARNRVAKDTTNSLALPLEKTLNGMPFSLRKDTECGR